jgi:hypothetical protein
MSSQKIEPADLEHRLLVITSWGFFGAFAFCFVVDGFHNAHLLAGLFGFALFIVAFAAHIIINGIFRTDFSTAEAALGLVVFVVAALSFIVSWLFDRSFGTTNLILGLLGFGAIFAAFLFYMFARFGMRGSFTLFDRLRDL